MLRKQNIVLTIAILCASLFGLVAPLRTDAQGQNLLINPGMENPYVGMGAPDQTAPTGWKLWFTGVPVTSFPQVDPYGIQIHSGGASWNIRKGDAPFTAGGFQQVPGIRIGSTIHATIYAESYTCNDRVHSCIGGDGKRHSDTSSGAILKVGVDPSGGTDPNSGQIVWSAPAAVFDNFTQLAVDVINCNTTVTFFMYTTQSRGMFINSVYFDDASLVVTKEGDPNAPATCGAAPGSPTGVAGATVVPTAPALAPFVKRQGDAEQPDGSIVHTVVAGDTLAAIAVAYGVTLDELRQLNNIKPGDNLLKLGQKITVRGPTPRTPTPAGVPPQPTSGSVLGVPTITPTNKVTPAQPAQPTLGAIVGVVTATPFASPTVHVTMIIQVPGDQVMAARLPDAPVTSRQSDDVLPLVGLIGLGSALMLLAGLWFMRR